MVEVFFSGYGYWQYCYHPGTQRDDDPPDVWMLTREGKHTGVFCLNGDDESVYTHAGSLDGITQLLPSTHVDSNFLRACKEESPKDCYFRIDTSKEIILVLVKDQGNINIKVDIEPMFNIIYQSDQLQILTQASEKFWGNADPKEKDTHTKNEIVTNWLIEQGFSKINAKQGATMIRPEWAAKGNY